MHEPHSLGAAREMDTLIALYQAQGRRRIGWALAYEQATCFRVRGA